MAYPSYIKEKARQLRREKKLTIDELAERLALPRTTIYYWVRDLPIPGSGSGGGFSNAARRKGNRAMKAKYRELREVAYDEGTTFFLHLDRQEGFREFVILFITEGHKRSRHAVSIANSDPAVVCHAAQWMRILSNKPLIYSIQYHADQDLGKLREFWASQLGAAPDEIRFQRKSNSGRLASRTWRSEFGVLTVTVYDTYFREEMQAWVDWVRNAWLDSTSVGA
jgi:transcriptional regulator with XRE-family HTH domain